MNLSANSHKRRCAALTVLLFLLFVPFFGQTAHPLNAPAQQDKPYVLLISLDGFRYDYPERDHAANLLALGKSGVRAKALIPSFPTTTFPNHFTIVTGLYPAHHGIVDNSFWDPARHAGFRSSDSAASTNGSWWGGTPLWVLAEHQGMRAASFFWPGSDAAIQNTRPTYYYKYDGKIPNEQRVAQVVAWLKLPKPERPHFITLYFSDVDHTGHEYGPDAPQTHEAIHRIDAILGTLFGELRALDLPLDIFVVSDHGMTAVTGDVDMSKLANLDGVQVTPNSTDFKFYSSDPARIDRLYAELHGKDPRIAVYRPAEIPKHLHYAGNPRIGDLVALAAAPVVLHLTPRPGQTGPKGMHGYDVAEMPQMRGIFFAAGPDLKAGVTIEEFQNIHIYPLIAHILGLTAPADIDGKLSVLAPILKARSAAASASR
ncbi:MAG TPA: ectonucleotide pyrophosphatase/phosphodiesterase [Bryobacteraceae bacterium]|nr:ectonucleotide pyrophosphatase/phosphodiesterase [Bryobacteraceae bacterium]